MLGVMSELERFAGWLACPDCERDLEPVSANALACSSGHRFEVNRRGHVGLIPSGWRLPPSRSTVATTGLSLTETLAAMLPRRGRVLQVTPESDELLSAIGTRPSLTVSVLSSSPRTLETIVAATGAAAVLADPARRWPVRDGAASALIASDAPSAPLEFHRVIAPGGTLILAPAEADAAGVIDDLFPWFEHDQSRPVPGSFRTGLRLRRRRRTLTW